MKILNDRVTSLLDECNNREEELASQAKIAQQVMEGYCATSLLNCRFIMFCFGNFSMDI